MYKRKRDRGDKEEINGKEKVRKRRIVNIGGCLLVEK